MSDDRWIVVRNWERFQHYRDRQPVWIKLYLELRDKDEWVRLTDAQKGLLVEVWLAWCASRGQVVCSRVASSMRAGDKQRALERLNHAGFIDFSASKPLALRYQAASPEKEEIKRREDLRGPVDNPVENGRWRCPDCPMDFASKPRLENHLYVSHGRE